MSKCRTNRIPKTSSSAVQGELVLKLPAGSYQAEWVDTKTGQVVARSQLEHNGGQQTFASPEFVVDIALHVKRT